MSELTEYQVELDEMLAKADYDDAMLFYKKWNPDEIVEPFDRDAFMAAIHKVRIRRGIGVVDSGRWLSFHGFKSMIEL